MLLNLFKTKYTFLVFFGIGLVIFNRLFGGVVNSSEFISPQFLPLEAEWCFSNGYCLLLEVADRNHEKKIGLMHRLSLIDGTGMWFHFSTSQRVNFWMYKTLIPLDMVFILEGYIVSINANVQPCPLLPCPSYGPSQSIDSVIELPAGTVDKLKIKVGDFVQINKEISSK